MSGHGHNETLKFCGLSGYYGSIPAGYGGLDWTDIDSLSQQTAHDGQHFETGYADTFRPHCEAILLGAPIGPASGYIVSTDLSETFSLKSMIAASNGQTDEQVNFRTYAYEHGRFVLKASDTITLSQEWQKIDFAKLGKGDFQNISAVDIVVSDSQYYGRHDAGAPSYVLAFTDLKVHWNGNIPIGHTAANGHPMLPHMHHIILPHLDVPASESHASQHDAADGHAEGYHSTSDSLGVAPGHSDPGGGLTGQFALPQPEHFGM